MQFPVDEYLINNMLIDNELSFSENEYQDSGVLFDLLTHLKSVHDKYYAKLRSKNYIKTKSFDQKISDLYSKYDKNSSDEYYTMICEIISDQQAYFKHF